MRTYPLGLIGTLLLSCGVGCVHLQPVGPMAKQMGVAEPVGPTTQAAPGVKVSSARDANNAPLLPPAPPPVPPAELVAPTDVSDENPRAAARKLLEEIDADRKAMDKMPRYSEISVVK